MNKQAIETSSHIRGLITAEIVNNSRDVEVYVRQAKDCAITSESAITVSPDSFASFVAPILHDLGYQVIESEEVD